MRESRSILYIVSVIVVLMLLGIGIFLVFVRVLSGDGNLFGL